MLFPAATRPDEAHKKSRGIFPPQACPLDTVARPSIESNNLQGTKATQSTSTIYYGPDLPRPQMTLYAPKGRSLPTEKISATLKPGLHKRRGGSRPLQRSTLKLKKKKKNPCSHFVAEPRWPLQSRGPGCSKLLFDTEVARGQANWLKRTRVLMDITPRTWAVNYWQGPPLTTQAYYTVNLGQQKPSDERLRAPTGLTPSLRPTSSSWAFPVCPGSCSPTRTLLLELSRQI